MTAPWAGKIFRNRDGEIKTNGLLNSSAQGRKAGRRPCWLPPKKKGNPFGNLQMASIHSAQTFNGKNEGYKKLASGVTCEMAGIRPNP
jgi:hypothetical protein